MFDNLDVSTLELSRPLSAVEILDELISAEDSCLYTIPALTG